MDEKLKIFLSTHLLGMPDFWSKDLKAQQAAQFALEAGFADLPDIMEVDPRVFDRAVEDAYEFFRGEALNMLEGVK